MSGREEKLNQKKLFNKKVLNSAKQELDRQKINDSFEYLENNFLSTNIESAVTNDKDPESEVSGVEDNVKNNLVLDLFDALGWDRNQGEVKWEDTADRGKVDTALKVDGNAKVYVEFKTWKKDLITRKSFNKYKSPVDQALKYAQSKGVPWVLVTNGYEYRLHKTYIEGENTAEYTEAFTLDDLNKKEKFAELYALIGRDEIEDLDNLFEKTRLRLKNIDSHVLDVLLECRSKLVKNIYENNKSEIEDAEALKENAQHILDRILFIRYAEDNGFFSEDVLLKSQYETWKNNTVTTNDLSDVLNSIFRYVDQGTEKSDFDGYNGELFKPHECEKLDISDSVLEYTIEKVYEDDKGDRLDFSEINADIVGTVYEKYLGWALEVKDEKITEESDPTERKDLGQYYTPPYVVNFIVEETLGHYFEENELTEEELSNLKMVDPACGSGAFLIKAYDKLREFYTAKYEEEKQKRGKKEGRELWDSFISVNQLSKFNELILQDNIHGVDLNQEAAEISKMNLWFKSMQKNRKLNELDHNIQVGNSVIKDPELAGDEAFNWESEFSEVFDENGGFDVIVGNPPYIKYANIPTEQRNYFHRDKGDTYECPAYKFDIYIVFIEKCIDLLAEGGRFSFIIPGTYTNAKYGDKLREKILEECDIEHIVNFSQVNVFGEDADVPNPSVIVLQKGRSEENTITVHTNIDDAQDFVTEDYDKYEINQSFFYRTPRNAFRYKNNVSSELVEVIDTIEENSSKLEEICYTIPGIETGCNPIFLTEDKLTDNHHPVQKGDEIKRFTMDDPSEYIWYIDHLFLEGEKAIEWVNTKFRCLECNSKTGALHEEDGGYITLEIVCPDCGYTFSTEVRNQLPKDEEEYTKSKIRDSHYLLEDESNEIAKIELKRPRTKKFIGSENKIFTQKVAGDRGLVSATGENYAVDSLIVSVLKKHLVEDEELNTNITEEDAEASQNYSEYEIVSLLNSKLINFYFRFLQSEDLNVYPRDLNNLPIKDSLDDRLEDKSRKLEKKIEELSNIDPEFSNYLNRKPIKKEIDLETFIDQYNLKIRKTPEDSSITANIKELWVETASSSEKNYDNNLIFKIKEKDGNGGYEVLRLETKDPAVTEFVKSIVNTKEDLGGNGNVLEILYSINIPLFEEDVSKNKQAILDIVTPYIENKESKAEIKSEIRDLRAEMDALIFKSYNLDIEEVEEVLDSINIDSGERRLIREKFIEL